MLGSLLTNLRSLRDETNVVDLYVPVRQNDALGYTLGIILIFAYIFFLGPLGSVIGVSCEAWVVLQHVFESSI